MYLSRREAVCDKILLSFVFSITCYVRLKIFGDFVFGILKIFVFFVLGIFKIWEFRK